MRQSFSGSSATVFGSRCVRLCWNTPQFPFLSSGARLAQSVEHETLNLRVVGSSPTLGALFFCRFFLHPTPTLSPVTNFYGKKIQYFTGLDGGKRELFFFQTTKKNVVTHFLVVNLIISGLFIRGFVSLQAWQTRKQPRPLLVGF